jgi:hypothetical protein
MKLFCVIRIRMDRGMLSQTKFLNLSYYIISGIWNIRSFPMGTEGSYPGDKADVG